MLQNTFDTVIDLHQKNSAKQLSGAWLRIILRSGNWSHTFGASLFG